MAEKTKHVVEQHGSHWSASSLRGPRRKKNSDAFAVTASGARHAFVVADGVGALEASPRASEAAAQAAVAWAAARRGIGADDAGELVAEVDRAVRAAVQEDPGATTIAFAAIECGRGVVVTVGDTEVLAVGKSGAARRLNPLDHVPSKPNMLLAWIDGTVEIDPHVIRLETMPYRLVLATDGVTGVLDNDIIADVVRRGPLEDAASRLVEAARAGGTDDDASAVVIGAAELTP